jgi:hypothetical protein
MNGKKAKQAGALRWEKPGRSELKGPEKGCLLFRKEQVDKTLRGKIPWERDLWEANDGREPERSKALRESGPRPDLIHPEARRGTASIAGERPLEHRVEA